MKAALLLAVLSFTLPSRSADHCQEIPFIDAGDLADVRAYGIRQAPLWNNLVSAMALCHTRADSNATFAFWWLVVDVKADCEPVLVRVKNEAGRQGYRDTMAVALPGVIRWYVVTRDSARNQSCRSNYR